MPHGCIRAPFVLGCRSEMDTKRSPSLLARLMQPHASSPRRLLVVVVLVTTILTLGAFGALP